MGRPKKDYKDRDILIPQDTAMFLVNLPAEDCQRIIESALLFVQSSAEQPYIPAPMENRMAETTWKVLLEKLKADRIKYIAKCEQNKANVESRYKTEEAEEVSKESECTTVHDGIRLATNTIQHNNNTTQFNSIQNSVCVVENRPTFEEVKHFVWESQLRHPEWGISNSDAEAKAFYSYCEEHNWRDSMEKPIKNWQGAFINWEKNPDHYTK